ncbi:MAG: endo-1,4-beta-xylanase [Lachnospiraceae bacterium]|nr:endo-1,4-beta-xylanase [Lachnospiraceae bacterium]
MKDLILKELYRDLFRIGVACERVKEKFPNNEIGNPEKEALMLKHFNSMTFANELKPAYNMGVKSHEATDTKLPFVINPNALYMLNWARNNKMHVRGHVMVWHSQCANEVFCKNYEPVTIPTDPELLKERPMLKFFEKLDPVCYVDRDTLIARMQSYIYNLLEYMYKEGFADTVYAWDVVNEAIELNDKTETGLRNSYWYQIIGDDLIYHAFRAAYDARQELSVKYADKYGIDPSDEEALKAIRPALFYNDYNEWQSEKKAAIIAALKREGHGHGSIIGEGLIDGIGMQGHLSDNNDVDEYISALREYAALVPQVHITELDVKCTCTNANAEYYQAVFYQKLFEGLKKAVEDGVNLTSVTLWGLTDDNSWIRGANPLLFRKDLSTKRSFDALASVITGESIGEPLDIKVDISDRNYTFEPAGGKPADLEALGIKYRGFGEVEVQDRVFKTGSHALAAEKRFSDWGGICFDVSDFIGQNIHLSGLVKTDALAVLLAEAVDQPKGNIAEVTAETEEWIPFDVTYKVPRSYNSLSLCFSTKEAREGVQSPLYIDSLKIELLGMEESFEEEKNIASVRGMGHLPMLMVNKEVAHEGGSSLLITRAEKDATVKFDVSPYIGRKIVFTAFVKTGDEKIRLGLDGQTPLLLSETDSVKNDWTEVKAEVLLDESLKSADIYLETEGKGDIYIDDIFVKSI